MSYQYLHTDHTGTYFLRVFCSWAPRSKSLWREIWSVRVGLASWIIYSLSQLWVPVMFLRLLRLTLDYQNCCCSFWTPWHTDIHPPSAEQRVMKGSLGPVERAPIVFTRIHKGKLRQDARGRLVKCSKLCEKDGRASWWNKISTTCQQELKVSSFGNQKWKASRCKAELHSFFFSRLMRN